jgi:hypothetical protein
MGHLGSCDRQYLLFSCALPDLRTFPPHLRVWGPIPSSYLVLIFGAHRVLSPKTTLMIPHRRTSQRLHLDQGLPQTSDQNQILFHHPPTQALSTIIDATKHPTFDNIPEIQLQPANMSTTAAGSNQNGRGASSTQTNRGAPH